MKVVLSGLSALCFIVAAVLYAVAGKWLQFAAALFMAVGMGALLSKDVKERLRP